MNEETAIDGIVKCVKHANSLLEAAQSLFAEDRVAGSALVVTAIEEYAKVYLIIMHFRGDIPDARFRREFRSHSDKRGVASLFALIATADVNGVKDAVKLRRLLKKLNFDAVRDSALYVEYRNRKFIAPIDDFPNIARVVKLALRLKRFCALFLDPKACADILKDTKNQEPSIDAWENFERSYLRKGRAIKNF